MEQPRRSADHPCPRCGAQRRADRTPSCGCGRQASDALREAREAQAAAAEDFDPLRIRPYVELGTPSASAPAPAEPDATMPLRAAGPGAPPGEASAVPPAAPAGAPSAADPRLFESAEREPGPALGPAADGGTDGDWDGGEGRPRRRRRGVLLGAAGAAVAVVAVAGYAGGLFSYETPSRDGALPREVRAGVPEPSAATASAPPAPPAGTPTRPGSASPSPSADGSPSASPTPAPTPSSASPTPSRSPSPTASPTTARPTATARQPGDDDREDGHESSVLRRGDRGPQVADLQTRLRKVYLYTGEVDGVFDQRVEDALRNFQWSRGIRSDELGVYGPETRQRLEAETSGR
ncbi:peptidoglycan-binding domain-containing protein [Streptomyces sp. NPDC052020]|uniref:peptidoglycan-binding domain-containing protein n=1 Tax=Streptomyces sp. NPDC052020 TaxID=3155677 RepID=UPI00343D2D59